MAGSQGPEDVPYHEQQERRTTNDSTMSDTSSRMVGPLVFADATSPRLGRGEQRRFSSSHHTISIPNSLVILLGSSSSFDNWHHCFCFDFCYYAYDNDHDGYGYQNNHKAYVQSTSALPTTTPTTTTTTTSSTSNTSTSTSTPHGPTCHTPDTADSIIDGYSLCHAQ